MYRRQDYEFQRQPNPTISPKWTITDDRKIVPFQQPSPKLTTDDGKAPQSKKQVLRNIPKYTSFVSDFSRIHGYNYKEALKDKEIKDLYRQTYKNTDAEFEVKHTFEEKRPVYTRPQNPVGKTIYLDPRLNEDEYKPTDLKELSQDQKRFSVARGLYVDLKRNFLNTIRSVGSYQHVIDQGYTENSLLPMSDKITKAICENLMSARNKSIMCVSPFMEVPIMLSSFNKYISTLNQNERKIYDFPLSNFGVETIERLSLTETNSNNFDIDECDTFFISDTYDEYIKLIIKILTKKDTQNYDILFTSTKKLDTMSDFYSTELGESIISEAMINSSNDEVSNVTKSLQNPNLSSVVVQEANEENTSNLNQAFQNYAGDSRNLLRSIEAGISAGNKNSKELQDLIKQQADTKQDDNLVMYYKLTENPTDNEFFKTSSSSSKIYKLSSILRSYTDPSKVEIYILKQGDRQVKLDGLFNPNNIRYVDIITDPEEYNDPSTKSISILDLRKTLSLDDVNFILSLLKGDMKDEERGQGMAGSHIREPKLKGGSLSDDLAYFKKIFNPTLKSVGKSGIMNIYKLSF